MNNYIRFFLSTKSNMEVYKIRFAGGTTQVPKEERLAQKTCPRKLVSILHGKLKNLVPNPIWSMGEGIYVMFEHLCMYENTRNQGIIIMLSNNTVCCKPGFDLHMPQLFAFL